MASNVEIQLKLLTASFDKGMDNVDKKLSKTNLTASAFAGTLAAMGAAAVVKGITNLAGAVVDMGTAAIMNAAKVETLTTQFEVLTGSAAIAKGIMDDLATFAATTPFQLEGLAEVSAQLLAFGVRADQLPDKLQKIGDVAAAAGADIGSLGLIFGQVKSAGKLTGERLLQLQERGIPILKSLAEQYSVTEARAREMVTEGKVQFGQFETAFNSLSAAGGIAFGGMEKKSKTLDGQLSTMGDNMFALSKNIGQVFLPAAKATVGEINDIIGNINHALFADPETIKDDFIYSTRLRLLAKSFVEIARARKAGDDETAASLQSHQDDLLRQIKDYRAKQKIINDKADEDEAKKAEEKQAKITENNNLKTQLESDHLANLAIIRQEASLAEGVFNTETAILGLEERQLAQEQELLDLQTLEQNKLEISIKASEDKAKSIKDADKRELALIDAQNKAKQAREQLTGKQRVDIAKFEAKQKDDLAQLEQQRQAGYLSAASGFLAAGLSLAKKGSKERKVLAIADATIGTYAGAANALGNPALPFPTNIAVAAGIVAQGLANVHQITSVGNFQDGGFIPGTSFSGDRLTANVNSGEFIANDQQQKNILAVANGEGGGGNMAEAINNLAAQPILVQIDGETVFEAVRSEVEGGRQLNRT